MLGSSEAVRGETGRGMSAFALTEEQRAYARQIRELASRELVPLAERRRVVLVTRHQASVPR